MGTLHTFGDNQRGQLGVGKLPGQTFIDEPREVLEVKDFVLEVSCGFRHTLVLTSKNVYGFGQNSTHELGLGDSARAMEREFFTPVKLRNLNDHEVVKISAGNFSCSITA